MKREYFGMLFMVIFVGIILTADYIFGEAIFTDYLGKYCVIWILIAYYVGQYSMKFPKA
jgi:hypothetical protein